jgi:hypothetical protein
VARSDSKNAIVLTLRVHEVIGKRTPETIIDVLAVGDDMSETPSVGNVGHPS